jgi:lipopolysaccharide export system protein LptA
MRTLLKKNTLVYCLSLTALLCFTLFAMAQSKRRASGTASTPTQKFVFGDITLSNYDTLSVELGRLAEAKGKNTTVDSVDVKNNTKSQLKAEHIIAYMLPKTNNQVERIEAEGHVHFMNTVFSKDNTQIQRISASGSKGVYFKTQNRLTLSGPVIFHAEQPSQDGKTINKIDGDSDSAEFDENTDILTFDGNVHVTIIAPESLDAPAKVNGDQIKVNIGVHPYKIDIQSGNVNFHPKESAPTKSK